MDSAAQSALMAEGGPARRGRDGDTPRMGRLQRQGLGRPAKGSGAAQGAPGDVSPIQRRKAGFRSAEDYDGRREHAMRDGGNGEGGLVLSGSDGN